MARYAFGSVRRVSLHAGGVAGALKHFYRELGSKIWGPYGFHDGFNQTEGWYDEVYMGLNQAQIVVGIENSRSGLVWRQFMANPEIEPMLTEIGFLAEKTGATVP